MRSLFLAVLILITSPAMAAFEVPPPGKYVTDEAGKLESSVSEAVSLALDKIHQSGGPQVAVLILPSVGDTSIEDAAYDVFKKWGIGKADKDNGVLLLVVLKERKVRIEVGNGLEGDLTDLYTQRIIDQQIVPQFRRGQFTEGVVLGVDGILNRMNPPIHLDDYMTMAPRQNVGVKIDKVELIIMIIFLLIMMSSRSGRSGLLGFILGSAMGGGRRGGYYDGGGSGWGGGFGGGGGSSGGGGASGSW